MEDLIKLAKLLSNIYDIGVSGKVMYGCHLAKVHPLVSVSRSPVKCLTQFAGLWLTETAEDNEEENVLKN